MKHPQFYIKYYPKKKGLNEWESTGVDVTNYVSYRSNDSVKKNSDASQVTFLIKNLFVGLATFDGIQYTVSGANFKTDEYKWFVLLDSNDNKYVIESNTTNTIILSKDFDYPGVPASGEIRIQTPSFNFEDICDFYIWNINDGIYEEPTNNVDKLVFIGQVIAISDKYDATQGAVKVVKFANFSERIIKYSMPAAFLKTGTLNTVPEIIQNVLDRVKSANKGSVNIIWDSNNPTTKSDGSAFPAINYYSDYKYSYEIIHDLCQNKYTGDGEYYFFVQPLSVNTYTFIWRKKDTTSYTDLIEGVDFILESRSVDAADAVNSLIIRCGQDPDGHNITTLAISPDIYGTRGKAVAHNFAGEIMSYEIHNDTTGAFDTSAGTDSLYPTSFPYTTVYSVTAEEQAKYPNKLTVGQYTANNKSDYRSWVRWLARAKAQVWGLTFMEHTAKIREKVTISFYNKPTALIPGNLNRLAIPSIGWTGGNVLSSDYRVILRNNSRTISLTKSGVKTSVEYLQDWEMA